MPDFKPVSSGDPLQISASDWNAILEVVRREFGQRLGPAGGVAGLPQVDPQVTVLVRNDSGGALGIKSVVALGTALTDPAGSPLTFLGRPVFSGDTPSATSDYFGVLLDPIASGGLGRAILLGVAVVTVNITDTGHTAATPTASDATRLTSAESGPALILWLESVATGNQTAVVLLCGSGGGGGGGGVDLEYDPNSGSNVLNSGVSNLYLTEVAGWNEPTETGTGSGKWALTLRSASATQVGIVDVSAQSFAGVKTFTSGAVVSTGATGALAVNDTTGALFKCVDGIIQLFVGYLGSSNSAALTVVGTDGTGYTTGSATVGGLQFVHGLYVAGTAITADAIVTTAPPGAAAAGGVAGQLRFDSGYLYVCTASGAWKRVAIATW